MAMFKNKPVNIIIEAITFDELVQYGRDNEANIVQGMPWSFQYKGYGITHENDQCYLFHGGSQGSYRFTPVDMLVTGMSGKLYPCPIEFFKELFKEE